MAEEESPGYTGDILDGIDLKSFVRQLIADVQAMRAGKMTVHKARAIADLSKQALRGIHLMLEGAKYLEQKSQPIGQGNTALLEGDVVTPSRRRRRK